MKAEEYRVESGTGIVFRTDSIVNAREWAVQDAKESGKRAIIYRAVEAYDCEKTVKQVNL